jgi:PAS domain S-box-containing protein
MTGLMKRLESSVRTWLCGVAIAVAVSSSAQVGIAQDHPRQRTVLVFHGTARDAQRAVTAERELRQTLGERLGEPVDYYSEYLDMGRFPDTDDAYRRFLAEKYRDRQPEIVIAVGDSGFEFIAMHRAELFPSVPVVYFVREPDATEIPNATGLVATVNFAETITLATRLHPGLKRVFVVSGASERDRAIAARARAELDSLESPLAFTYLAGLPAAELETGISDLPADAVILYLQMYADASGATYNPLEYLGRLATVANRPIYSWVDSTLGRGVVGGSMQSQQLEMRALAALVLRVLRGEPAGTIPRETIDFQRSEVDWRQLRRWKINEARVPADTQILFRTPGIWERYRPYLLGGVALLIGQTGLIAGLLIQSVRRRRAEEAVRESDERFRLLANAAPVMVRVSGVDNQCTDFNGAWLEFTGRTREEELGDGWTQGVHPDDLARCVETYCQAFDARAGFRMEYRLRRHDGEFRWVLDTGVPVFTNANGSFLGYIGSAIDITDLKRARTVLANLNRQLIAAHEEERAWIARELHDDLAQRMIGLTMQLRNLVRTAPAAAADLAGQLTQVCSGFVDLGRDVQVISRRLHASKLEYLGLAAAATDFCRQLSLERAVSIDFAHDGVPPELSREVALSMFRILQESLNNAVKHSGARRVVATLRGTHDQIELEVNDAGTGFDVESAMHTGGLGLISMRERVNLIGGEFEIRSGAGGTTIRARAPWRHDQMGWPGPATRKREASRPRSLAWD